ncbi:MAG TPA: hypothetical protein VFQ00_11605 [Terriglobales bacterium]|nr:hypothetical protein [Terriglobales bacterium]
MAKIFRRQQWGVFAVLFLISLAGLAFIVNRITNAGVHPPTSTLLQVILFCALVDFGTAWVIVTIWEQVLKRSANRR